MSCATGAAVAVGSRRLAVCRPAGNRSPRFAPPAWPCSQSCCCAIGPVNNAAHLDRAPVAGLRLARAAAVAGAAFLTRCLQEQLYALSVSPRGWQQHKQWNKGPSRRKGRASRRKSARLFASHRTDRAHENPHFRSTTAVAAARHDESIKCARRLVRGACWPGAACFDLRRATARPAERPEARVAEGSQMPPAARPGIRSPEAHTCSRRPAHGRAPRRQPPPAAARWHARPSLAQVASACQAPQRQKGNCTGALQRRRAASHEQQRAASTVT